MLSLDQLADIIADSFFNGSVVIAGIVMYVLLLGLLFAFTKNVFQSLIIALPITFVFSGAGLGLLPTDLVLLLIVILVLGLALSSKKVMAR